MALDMLSRWRRRRHPTAGPTPLDSPAEVVPIEPPVIPDPIDVVPAGLDAGVLDRLTDYVRVQVRSGVYEIDQLRTLVVEAAEAEIADPVLADETARDVLFVELENWRVDAQSWIGRTDCERIDGALSRLDRRDVMTLPALEDADVLAETIRIQGCPEGAVGYTVSDIWHAIDNDELPLRILDHDGAPATRSDPLVGAVMDVLAEEGLLAVFSRPAGSAAAASTPPAPGDTTVLVTMKWRRRPT